MSAVQMVMFSAFDLETYLPIARQAMGRGMASSADAESLSVEIHNMRCVAGLVGGATVSHLYYMAYLIAADERDMPDIIQIASMPHITTDSATRGIQVTIISGSLLSWSQAVLRGCASSASMQARNVWNLIHKDLQRRDLCGILGGVKQRPQKDSTYLLEHRP